MSNGGKAVPLNLPEWAGCRMDGDFVGGEELWVDQRDIAPARCLPRACGRRAGAARSSSRADPAGGAATEA